MKMRILAVLITAVTVMGSRAEAQRTIYQMVQQPRAWLGFQYSVDSRATNDIIVIQEVVADAPAQRAGLMVGDTLLSVNDIRASEELLASLGSTLNAGDTVHFRLRRSGRDREISVIAAERPAQYGAFAGPGFFLDRDTLQSRIRILVDSAMMRLDSLPMVYYRGRPGAFQFDTVMFGRLPDTRMFRLDTLIGGNRFSMHLFSPDSLRLALDSMRFHAMEPLRNMRIQGFGGVPSIIFGDTLMGVGGFSFLTHGQTVIAGAEMISMEEELAAFFGATAGVLVTRVHDGTPAARADMRAGDVILRVGGTEIDSVDDVRRAIVRAPTGRTVEIELLRNRARTTVRLNRD